jgi:hypothetical protein
LENDENGFKIIQAKANIPNNNIIHQRSRNLNWNSQYLGRIEYVSNEAIINASGRYLNTYNLDFSKGKTVSKFTNSFE